MAALWKFGPVLALAAVLLLWARPALAQQRPHTYVQVLLGAASFNRGDLTFTTPAPSGQTEPERVDLQQMPYLGLAFQVPLAGSRTEVGLDASILGGWRSRSVTIITGSNQVYIRMKTDFWLLDVAAGLFVRQPLGERWIVYLAAGPGMVFGSYHRSPEAAATATPDTRDDTEEAFGLGGYARAGLEYRLPANGFIGICLRGLASDLKFDSASSPSGLSGLQGFLTFSRRF